MQIKSKQKFIKNVLKSLAENTGGIEPLKTIKDSVKAALVL